MNDLSRLSTQFAFTRGPRISIVIPLRNEEETVEQQVERLLEMAAREHMALAEILLVDDGSDDLTWAVIESLAWRNARIRAIRLRRGFGKSTAQMVGAAAATGDIIVTMDSGAQHDAEDIPRLVAMIEMGNDLVSGYRHQHLSDRLAARVTGLKLKDFNCGFKAYRRSVLDALQVCGELHGYVPVLAHAMGFRIGEVAVRHIGHATTTGYGRRSIMRGLFELVNVMMLTRFANRPSHILATLGALMVAASGLMLGWIAVSSFAASTSVTNTSTLLIGILLGMLGIQFLLFAMLAELLVSRQSRPSKFDDLILDRKIHRGTPE